MQKPKNKTQDEIYNSQVSPYVDAGLSNPNYKENPNEKETGIEHNRGNKVSYKDNTVKPFSIGIQDIDEAIFYYFNNVIQPNIIQNGERINVPVEYVSPEKWKSFRSDGYFRDKSGAIMLPLIMIKRNQIQKNRNITNKLDANNPHLHYSFSQQYNKRNAYDNFDILNNRKPEKTYHAVVMPDYVTITYSCIIQTYYMDQLNKLIEAVNYASDSYWGDPKRYKFMSKIDSFQTNVEISEGKDRFVKGNFDIKLNGYIIPDIIQKDLNFNPIFNSKTKIIINTETVKKL